MEEMLDGRTVWNCPNCDQENYDDMQVTVFPMCSYCQLSFDWDDIEDYERERNIQ